MKVSKANVRTFTMEDGWVARVGCTDVDNDILVFQESFPQDMWLHVKGCPGSHVVLHHPEDSDPPKAVLQAAGRLAVQHSKAKNAGKAAVTLSRVSDLSKPRGAPAGQVVVRKGRTLTVQTRVRTNEEIPKPH
ncbi:MAG: DUF814 domain-containing protein [Verrucomicrobia bacterium]|nr:DUF814 domain-containing protein [Verrucomicrobiota bacterium]MCH8510912.1 NFACT RNA binding domain-containing protein [Kiritimatiellia bacterium]